jgi:hypothetical protein
MFTLRACVKNAVRRLEFELRTLQAKYAVSHYFILIGRSRLSI